MLAEGAPLSGTSLSHCENIFLSHFGWSLLTRAPDQSHTRPSSGLRIDIYARRTMRKDQHIGFVSDTIGAICSSILAGGAKGERLSHESDCAHGSHIR